MSFHPLWGCFLKIDQCSFTSFIFSYSQIKGNQFQFALTLYPRPLFAVVKLDNTTHDMPLIVEQQRCVVGYVAYALLHVGKRRKKSMLGKSLGEICRGETGEAPTRRKRSHPFAMFFLSRKSIASKLSFSPLSSLCFHIEQYYQEQQSDFLFRVHHHQLNT